MKIYELIDELIDGYVKKSCANGHGFICITLTSKNDQLRRDGDYDTPRYDIEGFLKELIALLTHEVHFEHASLRGLPYCMDGEDFDKFAKIGSQYIEEYLPEQDNYLSESMKVRIGILVQYGLDRDVPVIRKSE